MMQQTRSARRRFLTAGASGIVTGIAGAAGLVSPARAATACGGLPRERFIEYVTLFNNNDPRFIEFYHDDVVFELGTQVIRTPKAIREFYADVKAHIHEKVEVTHYVADATGIAALLPTEFKVYKDWENGFFQRPLTKGMVLRTVSIGLYRVENGKFREIKAARQKLINDWRIE